jgi:phosphoglucosamine mutase
LLRKTVVAEAADFGIAHDGDADRCLAVDANGEVVDGDQIMAILAVSLNRRGLLKENTLVATVMSNLGLENAMRENGINLLRTAVGDRYVLEEMDTDKYNLGGEQSGHVIFADHATTGDGILTGLQLAAEMVRTGKTLAELAGVMTKLPQVLVNVRGVSGAGAEADPAVLAVVSEVEAELGGKGRVLLRPSGTEPLIRVMVEADTEANAKRAADRIAEEVAKLAG